MRLALVFGVVGHLVRLFSMAFLAPLIFAAVERDWHAALHFGVAAVCGGLFGSLCVWWGVRQAQLFQRSEALAVVAFTWFFIALIAAVPYVLAGLSPTDAFFESMSGFTTTGATILTDFSRHSRSFFLWRAMTQWFGGLGVIALFVVVLPRLGIAGRQLFFAEASSTPGEAISPQVRHSARRLWMLYTALTLIVAGLLMFAGMDVYDGILHAFTTMSAGGFSTQFESIAAYANPTAEWILVVFMMLAGTSFTLQWRVFGGQPLGLFRDGEFKLYFAVSALATLVMAGLLADGVPTLDHVRTAAFQATSLASGTGFASVDFEQWGDPLKAVLAVVMVVGGCAGSAAGGPKVIRYLLVAKHVSSEITRVLHPRAILPMRYGHRAVPLEIMRAVFTLVALFLTGYFILGVAVVVSGVDMVTGFSAALACLGNIGPGFGAVGPMGSFAVLNDTAKWLLAIGMWVGRLEIVTVLALLHPHVWRNLRLR